MAERQTMKASKRETVLLWLLLEFLIHRYLLSLKRSGAERAERHIEISRILCQYKFATSEVTHDQVMEMHDLIAEKLTDHLDRTIKLNLSQDQAEWNFDLLSSRMFDALLKLL
jgi:hypothetical protein